MENLKRKRKLTVAHVRKFTALAKAAKLRNSGAVNLSTTGSDLESKTFYSMKRAIYLR